MCSTAQLHDTDMCLACYMNACASLSQSQVLCATSPCNIAKRLNAPSFMHLVMLPLRGELGTSHLVLSVCHRPRRSWIGNSSMLHCVHQKPMTAMWNVAPSSNTLYRMSGRAFAPHWPNQKWSMSAVGFEPTRSCLQWILSPPP